jgi:hypothetical protein
VVARRGEERRDMRSIRWKGRKGHDTVVARRGEERRGGT